MADIIAPTEQEWQGDDLYSIVEEVVRCSRDLKYINEVKYRDSDNTYWAINYVVPGDCSRYGLLEEECNSPFQVLPHKKVVEVVKYEKPRL